MLLFGAAFVYYPFVRTLLYSFSRVNFRGDITGFAGLGNFRRLFHDTVFWTALGNTLRLALIFVPLNLALSFALALLAAKKKPAAAVYETLFMIPMAVSMTAASEIYKMMLDPAVGWLSWLCGIDGGVFNQAATELYGLIAVCLWIGFPFDFLLLLAALRNVPVRLVEAAEMDGAGFWWKLFRVRVPMVSPTILYVVCTNAILAMLTSTPVMIITGGQPRHATDTLIFRMYTAGYQSSNYGTASCISIITFAITLMLVLIALRFDVKGPQYQ
jgi:sn-glycerol 3-phosphate transport system permease protein